MREHCYSVYILASDRNGTLYVGVTNSLSRRIAQHREGTAAGFTKKYGVSRLVWYRQFERVLNAIQFEKQLKRWRREWKLTLIEELNPTWADLYDQLFPEIPLPCHPGRSAAESRDPGVAAN
jgi:putative endonuclease